MIQPLHDRVLVERKEYDSYGQHWRLTKAYGQYLAEISKDGNHFGWMKKFIGPMQERKPEHKTHPECVFCRLEGN